MIFVTVGTQDKEFRRIFDMVEEQIKLGNINEEVVAQIGCTKFESKNIKTYKFMEKEEYNKFMKNARIVITHAGVGSLIEGLNLNKKMIVIPRLKKYGEHVNDHQLQILETFENRGHILAVRNTEEFTDALNKIKDFIPTKYVSNKENFINNLRNTIDKL